MRGCGVQEMEGERELARPVADFGESVTHLPAASVGKKKFDVRWEDVSGWGYR